MTYREPIYGGMVRRLGAQLNPPNPRMTLRCLTKSEYFSMKSDIPVNSETLVLTSSISRPTGSVSSTHSSFYAHGAPRSEVANVRA
jgi:hypothetical protein